MLLGGGGVGGGFLEPSLRQLQGNAKLGQESGSLSLVQEGCTGSNPRPSESSHETSMLSPSAGPEYPTIEAA